MAELFLARDPQRDELIVIKRILPYLSHEAEFVQMFLDEARIAAQLFHDNIVQVHELGKLEDSIFIAMEFVDGIDLRKILQEALERGGTVPLGVAAFITAAVCDGLHYAHNRVGIDGRRLELIHRDVSPQNVMVGYDGRVKLVDFGIAKANAYMERSKPGVIKGKFLYLSPEQLSHDRIDHRADLFAIGTMLYELTTGKSPFHKSTTEAVILAIRGEDPPPPHLVVPGYPVTLARIVMRCLTKDRDRRYQQASEIAQDLRAFMAAEAPMDARGVAAYIAGLFGDEGERTVLHIPPAAKAAPAAPKGPPVGTEPPTLKREAVGRPIAAGDDDDPRTQMARPQDLERALGDTASTAPIPARRPSGQAYAPVGAPSNAPEVTRTLTGASEVSQPTPSTTPDRMGVFVQEGPVFDVVAPGGSRASVRASKPRPPLPDEAFTDTGMGSDDEESTMDFGTLQSQAATRPPALGRIPPRQIILGAVVLAVLIIVLAAVARAFRSADGPELTPLPPGAVPSGEAAAVPIAPEEAPAETIEQTPGTLPPTTVSAADIARPAAKAVPVVFRAPRGTRIYVDDELRAVGTTHLLAPGEYTATYRCPGRRGARGERTFTLVDGQREAEVVSISCRRK